MFRILPTDHEFFVMFEKASQNIQEGAEILKDLLDNFVDVKEKARQIEEVEHRGDTITHDIIKKLNTTFITPIDREDILALSSSLDDIIDLIHAAATRIMLYKITESTPQALLLPLNRTRNSTLPLKAAVVALAEPVQTCAFQPASAT